MPEGQGAYSNYREVKYEFWAWYCALEGISITSDFARKVLLYIFYGHYQHKVTEKKVTRFVRKPIIHGIHYKLTNGRARFMNKVETCFAYFIELYNKNPDWDKFLDDNGAGSPPNLYFAAFEMGLRLMCKDKHTMGSSALKSRDKWATGVHLWRKREAYIALARFLRNDCPYKKWHCWLYHHYVERIEFGDTYKERHWHMFEASHFHNLLEDPESWAHHTGGVKRKRQQEVLSKTKPMRFCKKKACLVPY